MLASTALSHFIKREPSRALCVKTFVRVDLQRRGRMVLAYAQGGVES